LDAARGNTWPSTRSPSFRETESARKFCRRACACSKPPARRFNFQLEFTDYDWSCDRFAKTGKMMPDDGMETLKQFESIFLGAVGWPGVPDHVSLWGLLIPIRRDFDEYVNLRPVRLFEGVPSPLANRKPGEIDFWVVRENTEGEYSSIGGRMFQGTENEMAMQEAVFTRKGVDRVMKFAFEFASKGKKKHVTSATKSNGIIHTMPFWDERFDAMKKNYPDIKADQYHIDILTRISCATPTGSTWWWAPTCSATSCPISAPR
jgi:tartrate dehydrogenase/decarboxylase/D-malate dehydrogenase